MRTLYCIWAGILLLTAPVRGQTPAESAPEPTEYLVFLRGVPVGQEDVLVRTTAEGTTIVTRGRTLSPVTLELRRVEFRYGPDGAPRSFALDATSDGAEIVLRTRFSNGSAVSEGAVGGEAVSIAQAVSPQSLMLPNGIFGGFAALAPRLAAAAVGDEFAFFLLPGEEVAARLASVRQERMQTGRSLFDVTRHDLMLDDPGGSLAVIVTTGADGSLLRVSVPQRSIEVLRSDLAGVSSRAEVYSNPGDEAVVIPAAGFNLAATLTLPRAPSTPSEGTVRHPAVILVPGQSSPDRDSLARGVPVMGQLAGALADAGFMVVRYDRRGTGQSGGRTESATVRDYADDARTVVRWMSDRRDVDRRRIAIVGHGESAWIAMLTASREGRISALVTLAAAATPGAEMVLEQQRQSLDAARTTAAERAEQVALQQRIHEAVLTGQGWSDLPEDVRRLADTPWFHSLLEYDPAEVLDDVDTPVLIVHGDRDRQMPVGHAERLADLARQGDAESVELVIARGVTHQLTTAAAGDPLPGVSGRAIDPNVATVVTEWLTRTLPDPVRR